MENLWISEVMYHTIFITVLLGMCIVKSNKLSDPACRCYLFDSKRQKSGVFKSPNYPSTYPADSDCILYQFVGNASEVVKLTFWSFNIRRPEDRKCLDYVDLFTTIEPTTFSQLPRANSYAKTTRQPADYRLCGPLESIPQKEFYSINSVLILLLHSASIPDPDMQLLHGGFVGHFSFESKDQYQSNGQLSPGTLCTYHFDHRTGTRSGQFFSPRYPSNYPAGIRCHYQFEAADQDRIVLTFRVIELSLTTKDDSQNFAKRCRDFDRGVQKTDSLLVYEVVDSTRQQLAHICGRVNHVQIVSHGSQLHVDFISQEETFHGKGFHANYQFVHHTQVQPSPYVNSSMIQTVGGEPTGMPLVADASFKPSMQKSIQQDDGRNISLAWISPELLNPERGTVSPWSKMIYSKGYGMDNAGSVQSPGYPDKYPVSISMDVTFVGKVNERVQLSFVMLELGSSKTCNNSRLGDRITIYDGLTVYARRLAQFCGSPNSVFDQFNARAKKYETFSVTSSGRHLHLRFLSDDIPGEREYGFKVLYRFESRESSLDLFKPGAYNRTNLPVALKSGTNVTLNVRFYCTIRYAAWFWALLSIWIQCL